VVTAKDGEMALCVWKLAFLDVFDSRAVDSERDVVLFLAGDGARMAADAAVVIDDEAVAHSDDVSLLFSCRLTSIVSYASVVLHKWLYND